MRAQVRGTARVCRGGGWCVEGGERVVDCTQTGNVLTWSTATPPEGLLCRMRSRSRTAHSPQRTLSTACILAHIGLGRSSNTAPQTAGAPCSMQIMCI